MRKPSYAEVMRRKGEILERATKIDYAKYEQTEHTFDYEAMMHDVPYTLSEIASIQADLAVGNTPLVSLNRLTQLARQLAPKGLGAQILLKDEAQNASGSFKARRAALSVYEAKRLGYKGVVSATSGNYGAAVACMAAKLGLKAIIVQECYSHNLVGQPEILEKQRACEAYGAEVIQLTVGPELFYLALQILEETGYYNASLYTPTAIAGIETLGAEIATETLRRFGKFPEVVLATHAGGGNVTGTARGLRHIGATNTQIVGVSVDLAGLNMASDHDFNRKSFTTGHTGFGIPFVTKPDRSDVPRNAARALRYLDRYLLVKQGEVFAMTEMLASLEGMERGPAGNTSLTAAFALAQTLPQDQIVVVQETEYTGAGKHPTAQLTFARQNGIEVKMGDPDTEVAGKSIVLPLDPSCIKLRDYNLTAIRRSYLRNHLADQPNLSEQDIAYFVAETGLKSAAELTTLIKNLSA